MSDKPTWSGLFGIAPDYPLTDDDQARADIARLTRERDEARAALERLERFANFYLSETAVRAAIKGDS